MARSSCKASSSISESSQHGGGHIGKTTKDVDVTSAEDKIGELPDEILCHILSLFPTTKDAVQTSFLSRRWRYVWTSVPCIVLNYPYLQSPISRKLENRFADSVDRVLHLNQSSHLQKFSLDCHQACDMRRLNKWISNVLTGRCVEELHLCSDLRGELSPSIFTSKKLVILKLCQVCLNPPPSVCLPSLKTIHFDSVRLRNNDSMKNLLDGCPVLQELNYISDGLHNHITTLFIRSSSMQSLKLSMGYLAVNPIVLGIVVEAPNLERLEIDNWVTEKFEVNDLSSLVGVELSLYHYSHCYRTFSHNRLFELLGKMSNTKYMTLSSNTMPCLGWARIDSLPTFHNLIDLWVNNVQESSSQVLPCLLECSPNLINFRYGSSCKLQCREPKCLMSHLEKIRLVGFKGGPGEMKMIKYFLENAPVLKEMSILHKFSISIEAKIFEKLSMLPRRSTACQIEVHKSREK